MNIVVTLATLFFWPIICCAQTPEFVITKKEVPAAQRCSTSKLKEQLGHTTKDSFHASRSLIRALGKINVLVASLHEMQFKSLVEHDDLMLINKQGGELLITLSFLQKKFSGVLGCLLENQAPFKRAGKNDLSAAHTVMYDLTTALEQQKQQLKVCHESIVQRMQKNSGEERIPAFAGITDPLSKPTAQKNMSKQEQVSLREHVRKLSAMLSGFCQQSQQLKARINADTCLKQAS